MNNFFFLYFTNALRMTDMKLIYIQVFNINLLLTAVQRAMPRYNVSLD